jgi:hypothetical protein
MELLDFVYQRVPKHKSMQQINVAKLKQAKQSSHPHIELSSPRTISFWK